MYNNNNVDSSDMAEYSSPCELIATRYCPGSVGENDALISQGKPRQSKMSKVFEPIELLIPIEPWPVNDKQRERESVCEWVKGDGKKYIEIDGPYQ